MKAVYKILNPKFFIKHMKLISLYMDEGVIRFSDEIRLVGIDPSRISVIELKMGDDMIETTNKKMLEAPINLDDFSKIMKRFSNPSELEIICNIPDSMITVKGIIKNKKKTFRLSMIDIDNSDFQDPIPALSKIPYNSIFTIPPKDLVDAIKDTEIYAEVYTIETKVPNKLYVSGSGAVGDNNTEIELETEIYSNEKSSYSSKLTTGLIEKIDEDIMVMFKTDYPLAIYDKLSNKSHMLYYLAPRVEEEKL